MGAILHEVVAPDVVGLLDPLVIDDPASCRAQEFCDLAVALAAVLAGECDDVGCELCLTFPPSRNTSLRRAKLPVHAADPPFRQL